jgi:hypothetical protein
LETTPDANNVCCRCRRCDHQSFSTQANKVMHSVIGLILGFLERFFTPTAIVTEDSPQYPGWLAWIG